MMPSFTRVKGTMVLRRCLFLFSFLLGESVFFLGLAKADQRLSLENEFLHITLKVEKKNAVVEEFTSKAQGRDLAAHESSIPLFQVDLYQGSKPVTLDPRQASDLQLAKIDSETIELRAEFPRFGLSVRQRMQLKRSYPTASFSMNFKLTGKGYRLGVARMPGLGLSLNADEEKSVLLPIADGALLENPASRLKEGEKRSYNYPGLASAQLMAAFDKRGGVVYFAADGQGNFKMLTVMRYGKVLVLTFENVLYHLDPPDISMPYTVEVGAFEGGWERAADIYKLWATKQSWCKTLLQDRKMPLDLNSTSFSLGLNLREGGMDEKATNRISEIPAAVKGWSTGLGMPVNAILLSWEKRGPWIAPDYFPPYGGESAFRELTKTLHDQGQYSMAYLSGYNYTLDKTARLGAPAFRADPPNRKALEAAAITGPDGQVMRQGRAQEGTGMLAVLCPSTALAKQTVAKAFSQLRSYGVDRVQIDQVIGGGTPPCFSSQHGHPPVGGNSMYRSTARLLDSLAESDPAAVISLEEPGELFIQNVHQFHTRDYMENYWPRDGAGIKGIPLFNYLYHEYSFGYGGDTAPISQVGEDPAVAIYAQALNLINGRSPAAAVWMKVIPFEKVHADQKTFMANASAIWKGPVGIFLKRGTLLPLDHQIYFPWTLRAKAVGKPFEINTSKLLATAYRLSDGRTAIGYINITGAPLTAELRFASGRTAIPTGGKILWPVVGSGKALPKTLKSGDKYTFPPYGILFLESKP